MTFNFNKEIKINIYFFSFFIIPFDTWYITSYGGYLLAYYLITSNPCGLCKVPLDTMILQINVGCYMHVWVVLECYEFTMWGMFRVS